MVLGLQKWLWALWAEANLADGDILVPINLELTATIVHVRTQQLTRNVLVEYSHLPQPTLTGLADGAS